MYSVHILERILRGRRRGNPDNVGGSNDTETDETDTGEMVEMNLGLAIAIAVGGTIGTIALIIFLGLRWGYLEWTRIRWTLTVGIETEEDTEDRQ